MKYRISVDETKVTPEFLNKLFESDKFNNPSAIIDWCKDQNWVEADGKVVLYRTDSEENYNDHLRRIDGLY